MTTLARKGRQDYDKLAELPVYDVWFRYHVLIEMLETEESILDEIASEA